MSLIKQLPFKVGDEIKNYKEMCRLLGEKEREGNSRKSQLSRWKEHFDWEKNGHKFKIIKVSNESFPTHDDNMVGHSVKRYNEYIQHLLLNALYFFQKENTQDVSLNISHKGLVGVINLFNQVFYKLSFNKAYRKEIAKELDIKESLLRDFFQRINSTAKNDVESALKQLQRKGLIYVNQVMLVKPSEIYEKGIPIDKISIMDEFFTKYKHPELVEKFTAEFPVISNSTYQNTKSSTPNNYFLSSRIAHDFEQSAVLLCQHVALKKLNLNTVNHAYATDKVRLLQKETFYLTKKFIGINYSYKGFQIVFSKPILEKESLLNSFKLSQDALREIQLNLHSSFKEGIEENYTKRFNNGENNIKLAHGSGFIQYDTSEGIKTYLGEVCTLDNLSHSDKVLFSLSSKTELHNKLHSLFEIIMKDV